MLLTEQRCVKMAVLARIILTTWLHSDLLDMNVFSIYSETIIDIQ